MLNQIPPSRRLAILLSGIWLFVSGLFSSVIWRELFPDFDSTSSFLVSWFFVGVMPLGLVWCVAWVVSGYRLEHPQVAVHESEPSESGTDQRRAGESRPHRLRTDYRKGFKRLWIIATVIWYLLAIAVSGHQIGVWVGFHYALIKETQSFTRAAAEKRKLVSLFEACSKAKGSTCWVPGIDPLFPSTERIYLPNCEQTQAFRDVLSRELRARDVHLPPAGARGEPCPDILAIGIPEVDWGKFSLIALAPFSLMAIYLIGRWVIKGFVR